jgi:hippurate hydrolase
VIRRHDLVSIYQHLHRHPELGFQEHRTAGLVAGRLRANGFEVTEGVGGTGVVGMLRNGTGPTVLLRADMDGLPVRERTGLDYASVEEGTDRDGRTGPVMHACGHDMHITCLLGAAEQLAGDRAPWAGTVMAVFQPAEELGGGAQAMVDDGLFDRFDRPDMVLGQHVAPFPAGTLAVRPGVAFAAADSLRVRMFGRGAHGSRPETAVDPVVMAAATVLRLQTITSRELAAADTAVVTVGALHAGTAANIIGDEAELLLSIRTFDPDVRDRIMAAVTRIVTAEATASAAPRAPEITAMDSFPAVVNDADAVARVAAAFADRLGPGRVFDPGPVSGSEDVGILATACAAPLAYWLLGGADPALFTTGDVDDPALRTVPSNHSPMYAPVIEPTLTMGIDALLTAARCWLSGSPGQD